ncbi:PREDICTED: uncharacterized protein LOC104811494 [Tarenaya hassleriana]|uniref:uncharacterized protein LOC104811494 n=1 Tax=Tarenaya hassleriana TaxID=28532 RepID=UPI00053C758D|nr:PREDICTED: uncharacterized protein LOC104811494 [Tarenaya hassleriana]
MASDPKLMPEIGPDGLAREAPVIAYTERMIEEEQLQLKKYIEQNYSKIRDVERELSNLTMEMKLTAGPKKAALELLRKKIEVSNEKIRAAKQREEQARKAYEAAAKAVMDEEAVKHKLSEDLNSLVQESSNAQYARLEELKKRLEALNPSRASVSIPQVGNQENTTSTSTVTSSVASGTTQTHSGNAQNHGKGGGTQAVSDQEQKPPMAEGESKAKRKTQIQGKGRGLLAIGKGRGTSGSGWTGAGFDVDGRT